MQLNHDCIRDLLLAVEKHTNIDDHLYHDKLLSLSELEQYDNDTIIYTAQKLNEAGYLKGSLDYYLDNRPYIAISSLTYDGHTFLDTVRDEGIWKDTKQAASTVSGASVPVLFELGSAFLKSKLGLS
ncbi:DUF2513 domain-containing protein [Sediminibacillus sp. JSM 1682029]|uniref:DUF2513 domain-containing protein n=1 Tax=Sediminibacillus sp. JSM 1682029 TaxID=3229857 RepID=UPI003525BDEF